MLIKGLDQRYKGFTNVRIYCFDLMQHDYFADKLYFTLFVNYKDITYWTDNILAAPGGFCGWDGTKWKLKKNSSYYLIYKGLENIIANMENDERRLF